MKDFLLRKMALPTLVLIWAASYCLEVSGYSEKNNRLIIPIFWVMVLLWAINGIMDYREWKKTKKEQPGQAAPSQATSGQAVPSQATSDQTIPSQATPDKRSLSAVLRQGKNLSMISIIAAMVVYVAVLNTVGFLISTFLFAAAVLYFMGERAWYKLVGIPLILSVFLYVVFGILLSIPLPMGFLKW